MSHNTVEMGCNQYLQLPFSSDANAATKKKAPRKNPWGNSSYADLITEAIESSPEKKLTLSQIYDWMIRNVPHFSNQGASNSSAGWKNSIRHNLSLHERFLRLKNEDSSGKSSWWTVNRAVGAGRTTRRKNGGKKKTKSLSSVQKSLIKKLSESSAVKNYFPSSTVNENLQNVSNFHISTKRRWLSCSSTSSEDNESVQSFSSRSSPSCNESELVHRELLHCSHLTSKRLTELTPAQEFNGEFDCNSGSANLLLTPESYNPDELSSNGPDGYYSSFNRLSSQYNNPQNFLYDNKLKPMSVEETGFSTVSTEYFKSPHHLSGSYMTAEVSKMDNICNTIPILNKPDSFLITDLSTHMVQQSPSLIETLDSNHNSVLVSNEPQSLLKLPPINEYGKDVNSSIPLRDLNIWSESESGLALHRQAVQQTKVNTEALQNNLEFYCPKLEKIKPETYEEEETDFCEFTELRLKQSQVINSMTDQNCYDNDTVDQSCVGEASGYILDQEYLHEVSADHINSTYSQDQIRGKQLMNKDFKLEPNIFENQNLYYQQKEHNSIYNPEFLFWSDDFKWTLLPKGKENEKISDIALSSTLPSVSDSQLQINSSENTIDCPLDLQKSSHDSPDANDEGRNLDKRKNEEESDYFSMLKRPKLEKVSPKESGSCKVATTIAQPVDSYKESGNELDSTDVSLQQVYGRKSDR